MALPAINFQQKDMTGGQLTRSALRRDDAKLIRKGLRIALNARLLNTGGVENRFGRAVIGLDAGRTEVIRITGDQELRLQFSNGAVAMRDNTTGDLLASATGMPWTTDTLDEISFGSVGRSVVIGYRNVRPKVITLSSQPAAMIDRLAGTIMIYGQYFGNAGLFTGPASNAFNGVANETQTTGGFVQASVVAMGNGSQRVRLGKDFSGNPRKIGSAKIYGPTNDTIRTATDAGNNALNGESITIELRASNTTPNFAGSNNAVEPNSVLLGSITFNQTSNDATAHTINSNDLSTDYKYAWVEHATSGTRIFNLSELQFFTPAGDEQWSVGSFAFAAAAAGGLAQPFYRFAPGGVKMTPGQTAIGTGVTVNFDSNVLQPGHVGCYFRYGGKQLLCTGFTSPSQGTFSILETLPPTLPITVNSTAGFTAGMVVNGATSSASGIISSITSGTVMRVVMLNRYAGFVATETIVSASGAVATVSSVAGAVSPEAIEVWDESALSDLRGWPARVGADRNRITFCDVPGIPSAVLESKVSVYNDFLTGANASESIFEICPGNSRVLHIMGGADQFVLTEDGAYYIPISAGSPLAPGFIDFKKIDGSGASAVRPTQLKQGLVFVSANRKSVLAIVPTFSSGSPWTMKDVSEFYSDLFNQPKALAVAAGGDRAAEQYLYVLNTDGTAVVGRYDQAEQFVGFVPYVSASTIKWISAFVDQILFNILTSSVWTLEQTDSGKYLDGGVFLNTTTPGLRPDPEDLTKGRLWFWAGKTVDLMDGNRYLGARLLNENGAIVTQPGDDFSALTVVAGFKWEAQVSPLIPDNQEGQDAGQRLKRRRIKSAKATVQDTTEFEWCGRAFAKQPAVGQPSLYSGTVGGRSMGRSYDPEIMFRKTSPGPFRLIEIDGSATL